MRALPLSVAMVAAIASVGPVYADVAHEHGVARLYVVSEGGALTVEFVSPLDNLVGFEHAPRTDAQRTALRAAEARLRDATNLLLPSAEAQCVLQEVALESPWLQVAGDERDKGHDEDHGPSPSHDHEHAAVPADAHAEMVALYHYECAAPHKLERLHTRLFDAFPRLREIRAQRATASGQGAATLKPATPYLSW